MSQLFKDYINETRRKLSGNVGESNTATYEHSSHIDFGFFGCGAEFNFRFQF